MSGGRKAAARLARLPEMGASEPTKAKRGPKPHGWKLVSVRMSETDRARLERLAERLSERAGLRSGGLTLSHALREALSRGIDLMESEFRQAP